MFHILHLVLLQVSFFGLASFLMFNGIYSSAISVAEDSELRKSIVIVTWQHWNGTNGKRDWEEGIRIYKKKQYEMAEKTGIQSSLNDDMKQYLQQVIEEVNKTKNQSTEAS